MRYSIISKGLTVPQLEATVRQCGGGNLKIAYLSKQVFAELDNTALTRLKQNPGLVVKGIGEVKAASKFGPYPTKGQQLHIPRIHSGGVEVQQPIYALSQMQISSLFYELRELTTPPTIGEGITIAILDSGIRKTHRGLVNKVIDEANFSSSDTTDDIFSHGTSVAFTAAGGQHAPNQESGMAPGASLLNVKVLGDNGEGTLEEVILGLEYVYNMRKEAIDRGFQPWDTEYPNIINMSLGAEDDGDPDNPLRLAIQEITKAPAPYGIGIYAAAGNAGPSPGTITLPASMPEVFGIGVVTFSPFEVWEHSSRGPTLDGMVKPDFCFFGVDILTAESRDDEAFGVKSGTSFACPSSGAGGYGLMILLANLGMMDRDLAYSHRMPSEYEGFLRLICVKPSGIPADKDNDYGFGLPFGGQIMNMIRGGTLASSLEPMLPLMALAMMVPIMGMVGKVLK